MGRCLLILLLATLGPVGLAAGAATPERGMPATPERGMPATRAEVQIGLCSPLPDIERSLKLRPDGNPFEVWLFDDSALTLFDRGVRIRLRTKGKHAELTVKIANQDCARIDPRMVPPKIGKCEFDVHGADMAGAVSLSHKLSDKEWKHLAAGRVAPADMLSAVQIAYLHDVAKVWPLPAELRPLGPKQSRAYVMPDKSYEVDVSKLPSGELYVEMSHRVPAADGHRAKDAVDAMLKRAGVTACEDQSGQAANKLKLMLR